MNLNIPEASHFDSVCGNSNIFAIHQHQQFLMNNRFFGELLVGLLATIIGGIIVAWYIGEGEKFQSNPIIIRLTSNHCSPQDFYVDGEKVVASINPGSTLAFKTTKGNHLVYSCSPTTNICGEAISISWKTSSSYLIEEDSQCPITITLTNENCSSADFYVDGIVVVPGIAENSTVNFAVFPGTHDVKACRAGNPNSCGITHAVNWTQSTSHAIFRNPSCPITITLTNKNCVSQDFYVDGIVIVREIAANSTVNFAVLSGTHDVKACGVGNPDNCGTTLTINWTQSTSHAISRSPSCP